LDILKLPWIIDARELSLDQFLNLCAQINDIKCLRVTHDKGWIGYENEFILVKPHDIFFSFYDDIGLKLGRIESAVPPLPNYQYEEVALNN
jgi:hypothetical protein